MTITSSDEMDMLSKEYKLPQHERNEEPKPTSMHGIEKAQLKFRYPVDLESPHETEILAPRGKTRNLTEIGDSDNSQSNQSHSTRPLHAPDVVIFTDRLDGKSTRPALSEKGKSINLRTRNIHPGQVNKVKVQDYMDVVQLNDLLLPMRNSNRISARAYTQKVLPQVAAALIALSSSNGIQNLYSEQPLSGIAGDTNDGRFLEQLLETTDTATKKTIHLSNSQTFIISLGCLLSLIVLFLFSLVCSIWVHRTKTSLTLAQPTVLALFTIAGAMVTAGSFLMMPLNQHFCQWQAFCIFLPLTLMGCILVGRIWRINILMSPVLQVAAKKKVLPSQQQLQNVDQNGQEQSSDSRTKRRVSLVNLAQSPADSSDRKKTATAQTRRRRSSLLSADNGTATAKFMANRQVQEQQEAFVDACNRAAESQQKWHVKCKKLIIDSLTTLSDVQCWIEVLCSCCQLDGFCHGGLWGMCCCPFKSSPEDSAHIREQQLQHKRSSIKMRRARLRSNIRQNVPESRLYCLIMVMMIPQLILQLSGVFIPSLRTECREQQVIYLPLTTLLGKDASSQFNTGAAIEVVINACVRGPAAWAITSLGMVLSLFPFCLCLLLSLWSQHLPKVFNDAEAVLAAAKVYMLVLLLTVPSFIMGDSPDLKTFLLVCFVLGMTLPFVWTIVVRKLIPIWGRESVFIPDLLRPRGLLERRSSTNFFDETAGHQHGKKTHEKSATLALTIGKMYEELGMAQKSIKLFDDALNLWRFDPHRIDKELIGGFTIDEVNSFRGEDLEYIIQLNIAKGRVNGTYVSDGEEGQRSAAQAWLDALEIYERAPGSISIQDRSIIFPIFSGLFVFLKGGRIKQDENCSFERDLVKKFVHETQLYDDPIHYTRALAMEAEVYARIGKFHEALDAFDILKSIYDPEVHSNQIVKYYGTDRSAQAFSQSALWYRALKQEVDMFRSCEYVIRYLLPLMDPKNILNSFELLYPIICILYRRGQASRMRQLFEDHVLIPFQTHYGKDGMTPCLPLFKPMTVLLNLCSSGDNPMTKEQEDECAQWLIEERNGVIKDFLDQVFLKIGWSPNTITAECCQRMAARMPPSDKRRKLIKKGIEIARGVRDNCLDKSGNLKFPIAHSVNAPVLDELENLERQLRRRPSYMMMESFNIDCRFPAPGQGKDGNPAQVLAPHPSTVKNVQESAKVHLMRHSLCNSLGAAAAQGRRLSLLPNSFHGQRHKFSRSLSDPMNVKEIDGPDTEPGHGHEIQNKRFSGLSHFDSFDPTSLADGTSTPRRRVSAVSVLSASNRRASLTRCISDKFMRESFEEKSSLAFPPWKFKRRQTSDSNAMANNLNNSAERNGLHKFAPEEIPFESFQSSKDSVADDLEFLEAKYGKSIGILGTTVKISSMESLPQMDESFTLDP